MKADTVIYGKIYTSDPDNLYAESLAIKNKKIIYVGNTQTIKDYITDSTEIIKHEKGLITYGFTEGHTHATLGVYTRLYNQLLKGNDHAEYLKQIKEMISKHPDYNYYMAKGWISSIYEKGGPYAKDLDEIINDKPAIIYDFYGHSLWVNSKAMEVSNIDEHTKDVIGGVIHRYENGKPSGRFDDAAKELIINHMPKHSLSPEEKYANSIKVTQNALLSYGITCFLEAYLNPTPECGILSAYKLLDEQNKLIVNVRGAYEVQEKPDMSEKIKYVKKLKDGCKKNGKFQVSCVKVWMDGIVEVHTALMRNAYLDQPNYNGLQRITAEGLSKMTTETNQLGIDIHIHSIGDKALDEILKGLELSYQNRSLDPNIRNCICHLQFVPDESYEKFKKMNILANTGQFWACRLKNYHKLFQSYLGVEITDKMFPVKKFLEMGIPLSFGGDNVGADEDINPMDGIQIIVTRQIIDKSTEPLWIEEAISVEEAINAYTIGGAYQLHMENDHGMIKEGYIADLVLFDSDILTCDKFEIHKTKVVRTIVDGQTVYLKP